jgi:hypothetical protein
VYDDNATFVGEEFFKTTKVVKQWKDNKGPPFVDVKENQFQEMCAVLIVEKKFRIEIYSIDGGKWQLTKQASPGNISQVS